MDATTPRDAAAERRRRTQVRDNGGKVGPGRLLRAYEGSHTGLVDHLRLGLAEHTRTSSLTHDDVSIFVAEIVGGPPGPALWHVLRNRLGSWAPRPVGDVRPLSTLPSFSGS